MHPGYHAAWCPFLPSTMHCRVVKRLIAPPIMYTPFCFRFDVKRHIELLLKNLIQYTTDSISSEERSQRLGACYRLFSRLAQANDIIRGSKLPANSPLCTPKINIYTMPIHPPVRRILIFILIRRSKPTHVLKLQWGLRCLLLASSRVSSRVSGVGPQAKGEKEQNTPQIQLLHHSETWVRWQCLLIYP